MNDTLPVYNSRLIKLLLEYTAEKYPDTDIHSILKHAEITEFQVDAPGHWFNQLQSDRLYEMLSLKTGDRDIARKAGQYFFSAENIGATKQYSLGLLSTNFIYSSVESIYPIVSRAASTRITNLGPNKAEIISTPEPNISEKPYQCECRIGLFESLTKFTTGKLAEIEHPKCYHRGDSYCQYLISWEATPDVFWKRLRNYSFIIGFSVSVGAFFAMPISTWLFVPLLCLLVSMSFTLISSHYKQKEFSDTIKTQGNAAKDLIDEMNVHHSHTLLIQNVGQATSTLLDIDDIITTVVNVMEKYLDFDRGLLMLVDKKRTKLNLLKSYGYTAKQNELLHKIEISVDVSEYTDLFVTSFMEKKPFMLNNVEDSTNSLELPKGLDSLAIICVPIIYENKCLGILAVDNINTKRSLTQNDMGLMIGVASQTALSVANAMSFQKLKESEKKYRDLVENANSIILRRSTSGEIIFFNEFAQKFFGYNKDEILGKHILGTIYPNNEESKGNFKALLKTLEQSPEPQLISEDENMLRNGTRVWITWTHKPIFDKNGNLKEILCIGNDITNLKLAKREKQNLEAQLQQAQKMEAIGTLAGGVAHDFNNILGSILLNTELASEDVSENSRPAHALKQVIKASSHAKKLVDQILTFSRISDTEQIPLDIAILLKETLKMLRAAIPSTVIISEKAIIQHVTIMADPTKIQQLIINLCKNAAQAMEKNGGVLEVSLEAVEHDEASGKEPCINDSYIKLSVSDGGIGIAPEIKDRIFDPFFTTKPPGTGSGLGLSVVHGIVEDHNGKIEVESQPGCGTSFHVYLPKVADNAAAAQPEKKKSLLPTGIESILFVDDEHAILDANRRVLERLGYTVTNFSSSTEALEVFNTNPLKFDLVITDMTMPHMTGDILSKKLMQIRPDIPIILCSGYSEHMNSEKASAIGVNKFIMKPLTMKNISKAIREVLSDHGRINSDLAK